MEICKRIDEDMFRLFFFKIITVSFSCFRDCGEWFLYITKGNKFIRFSPCGNIFRWYEPKQ